MNDNHATPTYSRSALYGNLVTLLLELGALLSFLLLPWAEANFYFIDISGTGLQVAFHVNDILMISNDLLNLDLPFDTGRLFYPLIAIPFLIGGAMVATLYSLTLPRFNRTVLVLITILCYIAAALAFYWVTAFESLGIQLVGFTGVGFWLMVILSLCVPIPSIVWMRIEVENQSKTPRIDPSRLPSEEPLSSDSIASVAEMPASPEPEIQVQKQTWVLHNQITGEQVTLEEGNNAIGRSQSNKLVITSSKVSREHALIHITSQQVMLYDRASTHGTFVNGQRINGPTPLADNIEIAFGDNLFTLKRRG